MNDFTAGRNVIAANLPDAVRELREDWLPYLADVERLFEADFYIAQLEAPPAADEHPLVHYLRTGHQTQASPHPLFDAAFYLRTYPDLIHPRINPLVHFVKAGYAEGRMFHPLFFIDHYRRQAGLTEGTIVNLALHFLDEGLHRGWQPWPLWQPSAGGSFLDHLRQARGNAAAAVPQAAEFVELLSEVPALPPISGQLLELFDAKFYRQQLQRRGLSSDQPLLHYFRQGAALGLDPHPLFSTAWYYAQKPSLLERGVNPLEDYLYHATPEDVSIHPLFDSAYFRARYSTLSHETSSPAHRNPLLRYVRTALPERVPTTPLFDAVFYTETYEDVDWSQTDPFLHYLATGHEEHRWPSATFDPAFARKVLDELELPSNGNPLAAWVQAGVAVEGRPTLAFFDGDNYRGRIPEAIKAGIRPFDHFVRHGLRESRPANGLSSNSYFLEREPTEHARGAPPLGYYLRRRARQAVTGTPTQRMLFIGHDAGRTGAPLILLRIVEYFSVLGYECITILDKGGDLQEAFERCSHVCVKRQGRTAFMDGKISATDFAAEITQVLHVFRDAPPLLAICNSAEIWPYVPVLKKEGLAVSTLIHEFADFYDSVALDALVSDSDSIICPAEFVANRLRQWAPHAGPKIAVLPQGLLRDNYGAVQWGTRESVLRGHGIDPADMIVLACGTADGRKGIDIFVDVARLVVDRLRGSRSVTFVWLGGVFDTAFSSNARWLPAAWDTTRFWAAYDYRVSGASDHIRFIPPVEDTESFVSSADIFLMTSRADPFPCVVHEAMACGKPVIAFAGAGGTPEAIADTGCVVPYNDRVAMVDKIVELIEDRDRRLALGAAAERRVRTVYRYDDYCANLASEFSRVCGTPIRTKATAATLPSRRLFFSAAGWQVSSHSRRVERIGLHRQQQGDEVEVLLNGGRFVDSSNFTTAPTIPYRHLQPRSAQPADWRQLLERHLRVRAPLILFAGQDPATLEIADRLPSAVGLVAHADGIKPEDLDPILRKAGAWNRIVAASDEIATAIAERNPALRAITVVIPPSADQTPQDQLLTASGTRRDTLPHLKLVLTTEGEVERVGTPDILELLRTLTHRGVRFDLQVLGQREPEKMASALAVFVSGGMLTILPELTNAERRDRLLGSHVVMHLGPTRQVSDLLVEGLACGCVPVLVDAQPAALFKDGRNSLVVRPGARQLLADRLLRLSTDPTEWASLSAAAVSTWVQQGLDSAAMLARYDEMLDQISSEISERRYVRRSATN